MRGKAICSSPTAVPEIEPTIADFEVAISDILLFEGVDGNSLPTGQRKRLTSRYGTKVARRLNFRSLTER